LPKGRENMEVKALQARLTQLEKQVGLMEEQIQLLVKRNQSLQEDMKFFELMLLEEYHLLVQLLGKEQHQLRIHSVNSFFDEVK
jgi:chromosome segregation ATPase